MGAGGAGFVIDTGPLALVLVLVVIGFVVWVVLRNKRGSGK
jgi:hypothetical protein